MADDVFNMLCTHMRVRTYLCAQYLLSSRRQWGCTLTGKGVFCDGGVNVLEHADRTSRLAPYMATAWPHDPLPGSWRLQCPWARGPSGRQR